jgi:hypothetical protein
VDAGLGLTRGASEARAAIAQRRTAGTDERVVAAAEEAVAVQAAHAPAVQAATAAAAWRDEFNARSYPPPAVPPARRNHVMVHVHVSCRKCVQAEEAGKGKKPADTKKK